MSPMSDLDMPRKPAPVENDRDSDPRDYVARVDAFLGAPYGSPVAAAGDALVRAINERRIRHGDLPKWQAALDSLPTLDTDSLNVRDGRVCVGGSGTPEQQAQLRSALMQLCPWRKGPFEIGGVVIDTEWRSDVKWDRVLPALSSLQGRHVIDIGCGSGYHLWRMREAGAASVLGVEPMLQYTHQFDAVQRYAQDAAVHCLPLTLEQLPDSLLACNTIFSMGVLYHAAHPHAHLSALHARLRPGGECVLETLIVHDPDVSHPYSGDTELVLQGRYARMRNIKVLPSVGRVLRWMSNAGFLSPTVVSIEPTLVTEQRRTEWMPFESLEHALDPNDNRLTVEGLPAPCRAVIVARRS